ncbi:MAG: hypothetical protein RSD40_04660 [Bacilli bacterium]
MKNFIIFYYQIIPSLLRQRDKDYYFSSNNHYYLLTIYNRNNEESDSLYYLSELVRKQNNKYHKIILNKDHQVISYINKLPYVLLEIFYQETNNKSMNRILNEMITLQNDSHFQKLYRLNWKQLWEVKIDYFEYQISLFDKKYSLLAQSLPYFIGLAENAIAYFDAIKNFPKSYNDSLSVCHKRLVLSDTREVYNPLNLVIDHKSREIGEYLKQVFI